VHRAVFGPKSVPLLDGGQMARAAQTALSISEHPTLLSVDVAKLSRTDSGQWPATDPSEIHAAGVGESSAPQVGEADTIAAGHGAAVGFYGYQGPRSSLDPERSLAVIATRNPSVLVAARTDGIP
jgi:hypothetical protein